MAVRAHVVAGTRLPHPRCGWCSATQVFDDFKCAAETWATRRHGGAALAAADGASCGVGVGAPPATASLPPTAAAAAATEEEADVMRRYPRLSNVSLAFLEACCRCESALCHTARLDWLRYCTASVAGLTCPPPPRPPRGFAGAQERARAKLASVRRVRCDAAAGRAQAPGAPGAPPQAEPPLFGRGAATALQRSRAAAGTPA